ncbi:unnamed protein product [Dicrocoelium dendriticum]|nr:unnamed protein product [Dicrocoelium dendriticum]
MYTSFHRVFYLLTVSIICFHGGTLVRALDCTKAKQEWMRLRYMSNMENALDSISRESGAANICPISTGPSCCNQQMEQNMLVFGRRYLVDLASSQLLKVSDQMSNDSVALQHFFLSDLERAQDRLHQFFSRIYGYNYKLHHRFFFQFFADLKAYVTGERGQLDHLIDNFFNQLRDSIVSLIERSGQVQRSSSFHGASSDLANNLRSSVPGNPVSSADFSPAFDDNVSDEAGETRRIRCLSERMAQLRPFDDVDVRLKARIMEAYPPARMLVNVLSVTGRLLVHLLKQVSDRPECTIGITRFRFCALCAGKPMSYTCPESCGKLLSSCLSVNGPENAQINFIWPRLIDAILVATVRLERSFNFPAVNRHLQMDISEAITSLQTRYEQTKSKFQSECRLGLSGRTVPALFSSASSTNRLPHARMQSPPSSVWPLNTGGFRGNRLRRSAPSLASPELLDWQTRRQLPTGSSANFGLRPPEYGATSPPHAYDQGINGYAFDSDRGTSPSKVVPDPPENLMRWAAQLKRSYSSLSDLFASPESNFCTARMHPTAINTSSTAECWNPPELSNPNADRGLTETVQMLGLAAERLQIASSNNGDPETLALRLPPVEPKPVNLRVASLTPSSNEHFRSQASPSFSAQNRWNVNQQSGPYGFLEPSVEQDEPLGSGVGPAPGEREDLYESELQRPISNIEQPSHASLGSLGGRASDASGEFGRYQPYKTPNANQWPINAPNNIASATDAEYGELAVTREPSQPLIEMAVDQTTSPILRDIPSPATTTYKTVSEPTNTTTTTVEVTEQITTSFSTSTATAPTSDPPSVQTSETKSPQLGPLGKVTNAPYAPSTISVHEPNWQLNLPEAQQPVYGGLPDDEDSNRRPGLDNAVFPLQSTTPSPPWSEQQSSWSGGVQPNPYQGNWWEDPYVGGSGFPMPGQVPFNKPSHGPPPEKLNQPDSGAPPPYFPPGSGQLPFQPTPERSSDNFPSQPDRTFENQPPRWPNPAFQGGVTPDTEWADSKPVGTMERVSDWQESLQGSGIPDPSRFVPTHVQPSPATDTSPQPPINIPAIRTQSPILYPPLPPPEVWVPAQIGPGQSVPSVLLVREYNLQGPLYGSETVPSQTGRCSLPYNVCGFTTLILLAVLHCLLYALF